MKQTQIFSINTRTKDGITISTVKCSTINEAIAELDKRVPGMNKTCFVNITPEQADVVKAHVTSLGRVLYATKGKSFLLGLPKSEPASADQLASAFGIK